MTLNQYGTIIAESWEWLQEQYSYVELGTWVIMPNHLHGVIIIHPHSRKPKSLGRLVGAFKTVSSKKINLLRQTEGAVLWQRNYYEHIIRNQSDYERIADYIITNPIMWSDDDENPLKTAK